MEVKNHDTAAHIPSPPMKASLKQVSSCSVIRLAVC